MKVTLVADNPDKELAKNFNDHKKQVIKEINDSKNK